LSAHPLRGPSPHPIRRPDVQAEIEAWCDLLLSRTASATIDVTFTFDVKDGRFMGLRLGGLASRLVLEQKST
jgi:hypothetical protein